jgi:hypothetical protein
MMKRTLIAVLVAGGLTCFIAGAVTSYIFVKPVIDFAETAPLYILSEQTNVLKFLRSGREEEISEQLEDLVWFQISSHVERLALGKSPPDGLHRDFAYHCDRLRSNASQSSPETYRKREGWCSVLKA